MFWDKKNSTTSPTSLEPKSSPGYYPNFHTLDQKNYWDAATRKVVLDRVNNIPPIRFFDQEEVLTMQAIIDRVLPQDDRSDETRIPILPFLDKRLHTNQIEGYRYEDMPSDQEAYRLAIRAIDAMSQELHAKSFHLLLIIQQETILQSIHDAKPAAAPCSSPTAAQYITRTLTRGMRSALAVPLIHADTCASKAAKPSLGRSMNSAMNGSHPAIPSPTSRNNRASKNPRTTDRQVRIERLRSQHSGGRPLRRASRISRHQTRRTDAAD
jgi:hypothetical protein